MRIDVISPDRFDELADLMNRNCDLEYNRFTPELIQTRLWKYPHMHPEARLGALDGDRLVGAMIGGMTGDIGFIRLFAVDHEYRRQGLAGRMLSRLEDTLKAKGARTISVLTGDLGYFMPGLDPRYTEALCMTENRGYVRSDVVVNMIVPLRPDTVYDAPAEQAARKMRSHGIHIRRAEPADRPRVQAWTAKAFPGGWEAEVDMTFEFSPIPLWLAFRDDAVVGFAAYDVNMFAGGFGPTGVEEALQGKGIGAALLFRTLADMQSRGYVECEIGWLGPVAFYSHVVRARVNRAFWQMQKKLT